MQQKEIIEQLKLAKVIAKSLQCTISKKEKDTLTQWLNSNKKNNHFYQKIQEKSSIEQKKIDYQEINVEIAKLKVLKNIKKIKRIQRSKSLLKYAAIFIGIIGLGYFYQNESFFNQTTSALKLPENTITLQLENGDIKVITAESNHKITNPKGNIVGLQKGEKLIYENNLNPEKLIYNELTIPFGKKFQLVLSDGTEVFLNAGSSLKYPIKFIKGLPRKVFLKGEGFFKVTKNTEDAFVVNDANNFDTKVFGTHFNISSYNNNQNSEVVLVEGSVAVYDATKGFDKNTSVYLKPNEMASLEKGSSNIKVSTVDVSLHTSWLNGVLLFRGEKFQSILKKLERHYDVEIENNFIELDSRLFDGKFRIENIDEVLQTFTKSAPFKYEIKGKKIIINPLK